MNPTPEIGFLDRRRHRTRIVVGIHSVTHGQLLKLFLIAQLQVVDIPVESRLGQQFVVGAPLDDAAMIQHQDQVRIFERELVGCIAGRERARRAR